MNSPYQNFLASDVETGGLPSKNKKAFYDIALTEVALVAINSSLEIVEQKSWLIKPYKDDLVYDIGAEKASGISKKMCQDEGEDLEAVFPQIISFIKKYKQGSSLPVILGHNFIKFDSEFFLNMFEYMKYDITKFVNPEPEDTIKWARMCWPESNNYKLGTCVDNAGLSLVNAHRALTDTIATAQLWIYFMKNLRGIGDKADVKTTTYRDRFEL